MWIFEWVFGWFGSGEAASAGPFTKTKLREPFSSTNLRHSDMFTKTRQVVPYSQTIQKKRM